MMITFNDGKIIVDSALYEKHNYEVANNQLTVTFDGCGAISYYGVLGKEKSYQNDYMRLRFFVDDKPVDFLCRKQVKMIGRIQEIFFENNDAKFSIICFLNKDKNAVFEKIHVEKKRNAKISAGFYARSIFEHCSQTDKKTADSFNFKIISDTEFQCIRENEMLYFEDVFSIKLVYAFENMDLGHFLDDFDKYYDEQIQEIRNIELPKVKNELQKSLYYSTYFCAQENYKEIGDFKAFTAGCRYINPVRTYYRDSYRIVPLILDKNSLMLNIS